MTTMSFAPPISGADSMSLSITDAEVRGRPLLQLILELLHLLLKCLDTRGQFLDAALELAREFIDHGTARSESRRRRACRSRR